MNTEMSMLDIHRFYEVMGEEGVLISYKGHLDGDVIDMLTQLTEQKLAFARTRTKVKKKIVNILVEAIQNTYFYLEYAKEKNISVLKDVTTSFFLVLAQNDYQFALFTGNKIDNKQAEKLKERVRVVNELSEDELQDFYIKSINKEELPTKGGAGIGLVDILRRAKHQVSFQFDDSHSDYTQFSILVQVPINGE